MLAIVSAPVGKNSHAYMQNIGFEQHTGPTHAVEHSVRSMYGVERATQVQVDAEGDVMHKDAATLQRQGRDMALQEWPHDIFSQESEAALQALHVEERMVKLQTKDAVEAFKAKERAAVLEGHSHLAILEAQERILALQAKERAALLQGMMKPK